MLAVLVAACVATTANEACAQDTAAVTSQSPFECPGCLIPVAPDAERCPQCGVSFKKLEYECPKCKHAIAWDATSCPSCGLTFTPPKPGEKEKRSATERSMPATRDFIKNPPDEPANPGMEVHGRSLTLLRAGRETSFDGTTTIYRGVEDLSINVLHLGIPELSFHTNLELIGDPNQRPQRTYDIQLNEAYFRYETLDEKTQIQAGRQFINSGVTREFVDALFLHEMFGDRLGVELYGGHPVATNKSDPGGDIMAGGRVFFRGVPKLVSSWLRDLTLGFSFREELWDSRIVREDMGFDFSFSPTWDVDVSGHGYYSFVTESFYDARFTFMMRPTAWMQLTLDYRYLEPSALLPASSMFSVFADDKRHEIELDLDFYPTERLKLKGFARAYYIPNDQFTTALSRTKIDIGRDVPYEIGAGVSLKHGQTIKGELGGEISLVVKGGMQRFEGATVREASVFQARVYEMVSYDVADVHTIKGSIDFHLEANDGRVYVHQNSAAQLTITGGYVYDHKYAFTLGGDYRSTPDFRNTYDVFAKFEVPF